jgi:hypothetical protein
LLGSHARLSTRPQWGSDDASGARNAHGIIVRAMDEHPVLRLLQPDEKVEVQAPAGDALVVVTDRRLAVANAGRLMLDLPIDGLRRIEFDIERRRPATLVIVPEEPSSEPQVLAIDPSGLEAIGRALVIVGLRFAAAADEEQVG